MARTIDPKIAVPFTRSRFAWPAAGLALVACGLFAVRYAVTGTMSMEPSLVKMAYDTFFGQNPQQQAKNNIRKQATGQEFAARSGESGCADYAERADAGVADGVGGDAGCE